MVLVYFRSPPWFYGIDSLLEIVIIITSFIISFYSYKIFSLIRNRQHKYFSIAFFLIGFGYFLRIVSNIIIHKSIKINLQSLLTIIMPTTLSIELIHFYSFFLFKLLTAIGFLLLFTIAVEVTKKAVILVMTYITFLAILLSSLYGTTIYHTILVAFLLFICWYYYNNYLKIKSKQSYRTLIGFLFILLAHLIFPIDFPIFYVVGEISMIIGFFILLYNQIQLTSK